MHNQTGRKGEALAVDYFEKKGFEIIHRNWRSGRYEVDIIASYNGVLHFIEVKTRTSAAYGHPEDNVTPKKIKFLIDASEAFLYEFPQWKRIQFDVLSVLYNATGESSFFLIEDVYL